MKEKPSLFPGVPRLYIAINEDPATRKYDLRSVKACLCVLRTKATTLILGGST